MSESNEALRVGILHNPYRFRGGEDAVVEAQAAWLREAGHEAAVLLRRNAEVRGRLPMAGVAWRAPYDRSSRAAVRAFLRRHQVQLGHVHNWFPRLSPAVYDAHADLGIPVVQTLHNYRLGCAAATLVRDGHTCRSCVESGSRMPALRHRCYRGSLLQTEVWRRVMREGWQSGAFRERVSAYVAPSRAVAAAHVEFGLPREAIEVIPHASPDPLETGRLDALSRPPSGGGALFVGRLVPEKGLKRLLQAWETLEAPLTIVGTGPLEGWVRERAARLPRVQALGRVAPGEVARRIAQSALVVMPHHWDEPFGLTAVEAIACGRPVVASDLGGPRDVVRHGETGLLVAPEVEALREACRGLLGDGERLARFGAAARADYEARFRPAVHLERLLTLYRRLLSPEASRRAG